MKVEIFQSNTGDCLLLSSDGRHILVDGGYKGSFKEHTRATLAEIAAQEQTLDLVCVSHIDDDHISGIIQLLDDVLEWRVFDYQRSRRNKKAKEPSFARPPEIGEIWHNGFETQIGSEMTEVFESAVSMQIQAAVLGGNFLLAQAGQNLINGEAQAIELAHLVEPGLMNIPLNGPAGGQPLVLQANSPMTHQVGPMTLYLLGPYEEDLEQLHQEWKVWLRANQRKLITLQEQAEEKARRLGLTEEAALAQTMQMLAAELGNRTEVTTPNLASITFLAEEGEQRVLMTGDAHAAEIIKGLRLHQFLPEAGAPEAGAPEAGGPEAGGSFHVNVLKIQHHGAEANIDEAFCRAVTADHYVFCGNGGHENPEPEVVELIISSRVGEETAEGSNPHLRDPFTLWFNSSEAAAGSPSRAEHMRMVGEIVARLAEDKPDSFSFNFLDRESKFTIDLGEQGLAMIG